MSEQIRIPFSPPDITEAEIAEVADALRSGWITTGPKTKQLERELEWISMSPKGRHAKSKARIERYEKLLAEEGREKVAQSRIVLPVGIGDCEVRPMPIADFAADFTCNAPITLAMVGSMR